jgi:hypothetical protein
VRVDNLFKMLNRMWPYEDRPRYLQKKRTVGLYTIKELMGFKKDLLEEEGKKNLGEEVFARDSRHPKTKYRARTDDGRRKLHPARNFPTEHLGITGQVTHIHYLLPQLERPKS